MSLNRLRWISLGIGAFLLAVFVPACDSQQGAAQQSALAPVVGLALSGKATLADGTPIAVQAIRFRLTIQGSDLFSQGRNGCSRSDPHMGAVVSRESAPQDDGHYDVAFDLTQAASLTLPACTVDSVTSDRIESMRIEADIPADSAACTAYCSSASSPGSDHCMESCDTGSRYMRYSRGMGRDEIAAISSAQGAMVLKQDLVFSDLGPATQSNEGYDLRVNEAAALSSAHVTEEDFKPDSCAVVEGCLAGIGRRKLLRFDGNIQNVGTGPLYLGSPENNPLFEYSACHNHYHLKNIMLYKLLDPVTRATVRVNGAEVVGRKQGFCLIDMNQISPSALDAQYDCDNQGLSPGWEDAYDNSLDCQWLDVTGVPPGKYILQITVNPDGTFPEVNRSNNTSEIEVTIS